MSDQNEITGPVQVQREYEIRNGHHQVLKRITAESAVAAIARAGYSLSDVYAVPCFRHASTEPQPASQPAYAPGPVSSVQQVVNLSNNESHRKCPHLVHFVLTVLTAGLWLPVWIIDALITGRRK